MHTIFPGKKQDDMLESQMEGREDGDPEYRDSRNGYKPKTLRSSMGEISIRVPRGRNSDFEPQAAPKYQKNISESTERSSRCTRGE